MSSPDWFRVCFWQMIVNSALPAELDFFLNRWGWGSFVHSLRSSLAAVRTQYLVLLHVEILSFITVYGINTVFFLGCNAGALALRGCFRSWLFCLASRMA